LELKTRVIKGQYHDSVSLMLAAKEIKKIEGVADAAVVMGTDTNKALLKQAGLLTSEGEGASADDLVVAVKKDKDAESVLSQIEDFLARKPSAVEASSGQHIHTLREAARSKPGLNLVEISVAGPYAAREAREALVAGMHVLLFSDNVSLEDEVDLKRYAVSHGLLLMGPGAGTAIINGVGLGFANALSSGPVGIVSAAGTGLQEVSTILAWTGVGVSQAIGTGGRDLSRQVGGLMAVAGVEALIEDEHTKVIVLISKPAEKTVINKILSVLEKSEKECVVCTLGADFENAREDNLYFTSTLEECAFTAAVLVGYDGPDYQDFLHSEMRSQPARAKQLSQLLKPEQKYIRGLYSGGTLCYEAQVIWKDLLEDTVFSNAPLDKANYLKDGEMRSCHMALDLGEEEYTVGRPHPMIDNDLRVRFIVAAGEDPEIAVIVLDVVIGYGAHSDPGAELGEAISLARETAGTAGRVLHVITCVTGTKDDPQGLAETKQKLENVGAIVCNTNAQAARLSGMVVSV